MQPFIGYCVLVIVLFIAWCATAAVSEVRRKRRGAPYSASRQLFSFAAVLFMCYGLLACIGALLWVVGLVGVFLHENLPWLIDALLFPILQFLS